MVNKCIKTKKQNFSSKIYIKNYNISFCGTHFLVIMLIDWNNVMNSY